jgi:hypothetical protein
LDYITCEIGRQPTSEQVPVTSTLARGVLM